MGKFKMRSPIKVDPVPRYEVPFTPDNLEDNSGLVAKANKNGTMIINKNIPMHSKLRKVAESHEDQHLKDMMQGKLDYDDKAVYHNFDGKGVKMTLRSDFDESDKNLAWEKKAYAAGESMKEQDMRPNPNKLDGPPNMYEQDTPLSFIKQMGRKRREPDEDTVSMSEKFGTAMIKRFGPSKIEIGADPDPSGEGEDEKDLKKKAKQEAEKKLAQMKYQKETLADGRTRYFKSAEGSASDQGSSVVPASGGKPTADRDSYIANLKKRFPDATGQELVDKGYISSSFKDRFPSAKKETATVSDEYFETPETPTPPTIEYTTSNGDDDKKKPKRPPRNRRPLKFQLNIGRRPKNKKFKRGNTFKCPTF